MKCVANIKERVSFRVMFNFKLQVLVTDAILPLHILDRKTTLLSNFRKHHLTVGSNKGW